MTGRMGRSGRPGRSDGYSKWTVEYDEEVREQITSTVAKLRRMGLKGVSAKLVLNAMARKFLRECKRGKDETIVSRVSPLIKTEYERQTGARYPV